METEMAVGFFRVVEKFNAAEIFTCIVLFFAYKLIQMWRNKKIEPLTKGEVEGIVEKFVNKLDDRHTEISTQLATIKQKLDDKL